MGFYIAHQNEAVMGKQQRKFHLPAADIARKRIVNMSFHRRPRRMWASAMSRHYKADDKRMRAACLAGCTGVMRKAAKIDMRNKAARNQEIAKITMPRPIAADNALVITCIVILISLSFTLPRGHRGSAAFYLIGGD